MIKFLQFDRQTFFSEITIRIIKCQFFLTEHCLFFYIYLQWKKRKNELRKKLTRTLIIMILE